MEKISEDKEKMKQKILLSVILPVYNEEASVERGVINEVWTYLKKQKYSWEVIVVDDGSTDKSKVKISAVAKAMADKQNSKVSFKSKKLIILEQKHMGKAIALVKGIKQAQGEIALLADFDQSTPLSEIEKFWPYFEKGNVGVIGVRGERDKQPLIRKTASWGFISLRKIILDLPYQDTQSGFKAFKRKELLKIIEQVRTVNSFQLNKPQFGVGFDLEILYLARKMGLRIAEVPVEWSYKTSGRTQIVRDSWAAFQDLIKVKRNAILGRYDARS